MKVNWRELFLPPVPTLKTTINFSFWPHYSEIVLVTIALNSAILERWHMYLDHLEAQVAFVEHDNFIFICSFIYHVSESQQLLPVGQDCAAPGWVPFMANHNFFFKGLDCFIQNCWVLVLIRACELVLVVQEKVPNRSGTLMKTQKQLTVNKILASKQSSADPLQVTWHLIENIFCELHLTVAQKDTISVLL